jgi:carboxypeptidase Taq
MTDAWNKLVKRMEELTDLYGIASLVEWDQAVLMPPKGGASRARASATLGGIMHNRLTDPAIGDLLAELEADDSLDDVQKRSVQLLRRDYDRETKVPADLVRELTETTNIAYQVWTEARPASDFAVFEPHLKRVVELKKQQADAIGYEGERYDALLDLYEPGMTSVEVEAMFEELVEGLKPIVDLVLDARNPEPEFLKRSYEVDKQQRFSQWLTRHIGFDGEAGRLDTSPHPFTIMVGHGDIRQTTRYSESDLPSSIYATLHETGHALYDQGFPEQWQDLPVGGYASLGMHQSQSRMWENQVGRSREFSAFMLPELKKLFETELGSVAPDEFFEGVNYPERSMIRVEADELTYNLHIVMRFELELALFRDELDVPDLPEAWNDKMEQHLGIRPEDDSEGVLQDMHWAGGMQGYFPTYSLGTIYSAALFDKAKKDLGGLEEDFRSGETARLLEWLRTNIHSKGHMLDAKDLATKVLGEQPTAKPLLDYLKGKYSDIYSITL